jgi:hypothetical protein
MADKKPTTKAKKGRKRKKRVVGVDGKAFIQARSGFGKITNKKSNDDFDDFEELK